MKNRFKPYYEGEAAYVKGVTTNPYKDGTDEYEHWQDGYDCAQQSALDNEYMANARSKRQSHVYE